MRHLTLLLCILSASVLRISLAATFDPDAGSAPLIAMFEERPPAVLITPPAVSAIYEDGEVIFSRRGTVSPQDPETSRSSRTWFHCKLTSAQLEGIRPQLEQAIAANVSPSYDLLPGENDQPYTWLYTRSGDHELATRIRGLESTATVAACSEKMEVMKSHMLPDSLLDLHRVMSTMDWPDAQPWTPRYAAVDVRQLDGVETQTLSEKPEKWPEGWPGLKSPRALRLNKDNSVCTIFLDGSLMPEIETAMMRLYGFFVYVDIDGTCVTVTSYWRHFPYERIAWNAWERIDSKPTESGIPLSLPERLRRLKQL